MTDQVKEAVGFLDLPWASLLTLACGYAGYFVAHVGMRNHHKTIDVVFATFVFGFISTFVYQLLIRQAGAGILTASAISFVFSIAAGGIWNSVGRTLFYLGLRKSGTNTDDLPTAWSELFAGRKTDVTQVSIKLNDGTWLKSTRMARFDQSPHGAITLGGAGDVLLYVTHVQAPGEDEFTEEGAVLNPAWGDEITYIPKEQIARLIVRKKWR